jgi:hypothetical protein
MAAYTPKKKGEEGREELEAALALPTNSQACRHYFVGKGCVRGEKCKFKHLLQT